MAVVLAGMLLVVMVIVIALLLEICKKRCNRGRKIAECVTVVCVKVFVVCVRVCKKLTFSPKYNNLYVKMMTCTLYIHNMYFVILLVSCPVGMCCRIINFPKAIY